MSKIDRTSKFHLHAGGAALNWVLGAIAMSSLTIGLSSVHADGIVTRDCISSGRGFSCSTIWRQGLANPYFIRVPLPRSDEDLADMAERDRLWQARCNPTIRQDDYGVRRYHYSAAGCEFGEYE